MAKLTRIFAQKGKRASAKRLSEIEAALGKRLPEDYKQLLQKTGGGTLKPDCSFITGITLASGEELDIGVETIYGNGTTRNGTNIDLVDYVMFLMQEWEIPDEVLLLADTEDGMHQCFVINYGVEGFPVGAILHCDTDPDGQMTLVADSVTDFLEKLGPDPYESSTDSSDQYGMGIKGIQHGALSETLQHAIRATPTPDIERLLRKAAEPVANDMNPAILYNSVEGRRFFDVLYWIAQHVQPQPDPVTYVNVNRNEQEIFLGNLLSGSFKMPTQKYGFIYTPAAVEAWWNIRVAEGVLNPTEKGYVLDGGYIENVLEELRG